MKAQNAEWYKNGWTLDIKNQSWVEDTENQVDFIIKTLNLPVKNVFLSKTDAMRKKYQLLLEHIIFLVLIVVLKHKWRTIFQLLAL